MSNRTSPLLACLLAPEVWAELIAEATVGRRRRRRLSAYRQLVGSGAMARVVEAAAEGRWVPSPPVRHHLNKPDGRQKVVFTFGAEAELFFKALNRVLQPVVEPGLSPLCHSFRPGHGPRSAYGQVFRVGGLDGLASLHVDVRDYFNSIPVEGLMSSLPPAIADDGALWLLLARTLRDRRVRSEGRIVEDGHKGAMAGTPLAPLLSNLYLGPLDRAFSDSDVTYVRYADDVLILGSPAALVSAREVIDGHLASLGLELNPRKTRYGAPGAPWEFLGFRYSDGRLDVAPLTAAKLRRRARRMARRALERPDGLAWMVRRLNRRLFGVGGRREDFSWAGWFFPLLSRTSTLSQLDTVIQNQLRFAVTGRHERRNLGVVPYEALVAAGYVPLVTAYHAFRRSRGDFEDLIERRVTG